MQIFNTLTRQKEEFVPQVPGEYRIYVCGPTVYNYIHIGNARPLIVFDTLRRYLEYRGNKVIYVSNITDIDDKLIKKGQEEGTSMKEVAQRFEAEYLKDAAGLNCKKPTVGTTLLSACSSPALSCCGWAALPRQTRRSLPTVTAPCFTACPSLKPF